MTEDTLVINLEPELLKQAEAICEDMGFSLATACTIFCKAVVRTRSIPFSIQASDPFWSETNQKYLRKSIKDLDESKGQEHELIET